MLLLQLAVPNSHARRFGGLQAEAKINLQRRRRFALQAVDLKEKDKYKSTENTGPVLFPRSSRFERLE